jgi:threonine-phosphate decarboxylase
LPASFKDETGGHGGDLAAALKLWNPVNGEFLDFSSNINPLSPPAGMLEHLGSLLPAITAYPTPQARELRKKLAGFLGLGEERLLLGNGANELIHLLMLWLRPRRVLVPAPSFSEYERAATLIGAAVQRFPLLPDRDLDSQSLIKELDQGDMLVFCNPNNPTGKLYKRDVMLQLVNAAAECGAVMMLDESFIPLTGHNEESLRDLQTQHLWVIISLTKIWGLPGLRLGCTIGPAAGISQLAKWGDPWRVNYLAQEAGLYCLGQDHFIEETLNLVFREREYLSHKLSETGRFRVFEGAANYLLVRGLDPSFRIDLFQADLARGGLLVRRADNFPGLDQRYFRIAVRKRADNERLLRAIEHWCKKCPSGDSNNDKRGEDR